MESFGYLHLCLLQECDVELQSIPSSYKAGVAAFLLLSCMVATTNADAAYSSAYRPCYEESSFVLDSPDLPLLQLESKGDRVSEIQRQLKNWGFPLDPNQKLTSGVFDTQTEKAVKQFQSYVGLNSDGIVGTKTLNTLFTPRTINPQLINTTLKRGGTGELVGNLQTALGILGWKELEVDSIFGTQTQAAVREFQSYVKLQPNGIFDARTARALAEVCQQEEGNCEYYSVTPITTWREQVKAKFASTRSNKAKSLPPTSQAKPTSTRKKQTSTN